MPETMTFNREKLIEDYVHLVLDEMDMDTLVSFAYDSLIENLSAYSDQTLIEEVTEYNPELLEDVTV